MSNKSTLAMYIFTYFYLLFFADYSIKDNAVDRTMYIDYDFMHRLRASLVVLIIFVLSSQFIVRILCISSKCQLVAYFICYLLLLFFTLDLKTYFYDGAKYLVFFDIGYDYLRFVCSLIGCSLFTLFHILASVFFDNNSTV